jgi:pimeloyl-ACP methyl ester carboxylesterase
MGREVFVREAGEGAPLLFFHGFPTSSYDWSDVFAALEVKHRCIAFDFWGFGDTDPLDAYDYDKQTDLALAVAKHFALDRAVIVAHDYGVTVAQELLARRAPALAIDGVVFLNGGIDPRLHRPIAIQRLLASPLGAWVGPLLVRKVTFRRSMGRIITVTDRFDIDEHWSAMSARGAHRRSHQLLHYIADRQSMRDRLVAAFSDRATPVALAWGERDPVSGAHVLAWAKSARPDAEALALPVGHYPQVESPAEVSALIERFADRVRRRA